MTSTSSTSSLSNKFSALTLNSSSADASSNLTTKVDKSSKEPLRDLDSTTEYMDLSSNKAIGFSVTRVGSSTQKSEGKSSIQFTSNKPTTLYPLPRTSSSLDVLVPDTDFAYLTVGSGVEETALVSSPRSPKYRKKYGTFVHDPCNTFIDAYDSLVLRLFPDKGVVDIDFLFPTLDPYGFVQIQLEWSDDRITDYLATYLQIRNFKDCIKNIQFRGKFVYHFRTNSICQAKALWVLYRKNYRISINVLEKMAYLFAKVRLSQEELFHELETVRLERNFLTSEIANLMNQLFTQKSITLSKSIIDYLMNCGRVDPSTLERISVQVEGNSQEITQKK